MILEMFIDLASPYAYLGLVRMLSHGDAARIHWHPVDVEALKRAAGNVGPPLRQMPAKLRYARQDVARWAARYGVPFSEAASCAAAPRLNRGTYFAIDRGAAATYLRTAARRVWAEGGDPESEALLRDLSRELGWDAGDFLRFVSSPAAFHRERLSLARAREAGAFGVPTAVVGGRLWWGNDRLFLAEAAWAGGENQGSEHG